MLVYKPPVLPWAVLRACVCVCARHQPVTRVVSGRVITTLHAPHPWVHNEYGYCITIDRFNVHVHISTSTLNLHVLCTICWRGTLHYYTCIYTVALTLHVTITYLNLLQTLHVYVYMFIFTSNFTDSHLLNGQVTSLYTFTLSLYFVQQPLSRQNDCLLLFKYFYKQTVFIITKNVFLNKVQIHHLAAFISEAIRKRVERSELLYFSVILFQPRIEKKIT